MGSSTPQTRTLRRALERGGSADTLAQLLDCDTAALDAWLSGAERTPSDVYLRALDIVAGRPPDGTAPR